MLQDGINDQVQLLEKSATNLSTIEALEASSLFSPPMSKILRDGLSVNVSLESQKAKQVSCQGDSCFEAKTSHRPLSRFISTPAGGTGPSSPKFQNPSRKERLSDMNKVPTNLLHLQATQHILRIHTLLKNNCRYEHYSPRTRSIARLSRPPSKSFSSQPTADFSTPLPHCFTPHRHHILQVLLHHLLIRKRRLRRCLTTDEPFDARINMSHPLQY